VTDVRRSCGLLALVLATAPLGVACSQAEATDEDDQAASADGTDHPVAMAAAYDVQLLLPSTFECLPVRNDEAVNRDEYPVPRPPFSEKIFPCTRCHDKPDDFNTESRTLTLEHTDIKLAHGPREQWCYDCHNPSGRDQLRLAGGRLIPFEKSYELCGQCHGEKLRDWRAGIHGRRTGCWNGKREYLLCVNCHNQHSPKFAPRKPLPRPKKPTEIRRAHKSGGQP